MINNYTLNEKALKLLHEGSFSLFKHSGLLCCVQRGPLGCLNGYTAGPESHPAYGKRYDELDISVHGGLTFGANSLMGIEDGLFEPLYWFGFDTAHSGDIVPFYPTSISELAIFDNASYKDMEYVLAETKNLADQLAVYQLNE